MLASTRLRHAGLQRRDPLGVADGDDRLRGRLAVQPALAHPGALEGRVDLAQPGRVALEQRVGVELEQRVAGREVVGDVEEAPAVVALRLDEVRVLDEADERQLRVGDVGPVERAEAAVELEQQAQRGVVLDALAAGRGTRARSRRRGRRRAGRGRRRWAPSPRRRRSARGASRSRRRAGSWPGPERAGRAGGDLEALGDRAAAAPRAGRSARARRRLDARRAARRTAAPTSAAGSRAAPGAPPCPRAGGAS